MNPPSGQIARKAGRLRQNRLCEQLINVQGQVTQGVLNQLRVLATPAAHRDVSRLLGPNYCQLPAIYVQVDTRADRYVYQLTHAPHRWLVVLYERDQYVGYAIWDEPRADE
ncbi:hypothetical protein IQ266_01930 [filamentous cyanobacterium LEGE 11480]|uniref:Uncharacterized protein n=2 Tax=Romeriopsis TaxID=2992131 RepID=A0A928VHM6_9CYAN|nr:hypothetical protein [Romeriopsis navalis LEGE 11480]